MFGKSDKSTRRIKLPFESKDEKPYIFASYGHDDKEKVFPLLKAIYESGYNIWYDEGITIGEKYDEVIESHIRQSAVFLLFASSLSLSRPYVLDVELKLAEESSGRVPFLALFIERNVDVPVQAEKLIGNAKYDRLNDILHQLKELGVENFGKRKAVPIEREVPQYWFDSHDLDPAGESGNIVWSVEEPFACLAFHPDDLTSCNPFAKELFFAGYNVRSCENFGEAERRKMLSSKGCMAYVPFVTKKYIESGALEKDFLAARKAGKPLIPLYTRQDGEQEESVKLPDSIAKEFSLIQGLDMRELTANDFLSKLETELEKRKCYACMTDGKVSRRNFEIKDFFYDFADGGKKLILTKYRGEKEKTSLTVRRAYSGFPVAEIGADAFRYASLREVSLPEGLEWIGNGAFHDCDNLESVSLPDSLTGIGERSFSKCCALKSVRLPSGVREIPKGAFENCDSLTEFVIPDGVTAIGALAFDGCANLTSVTIPDSIVSIGDMAFSQCECLTSVEIPDSVDAFGDGVFMWCNSLASVRLSCNMNGTGSETFTGCSALEHIEIPEGITLVEAYAFHMADGLKTVTLPESLTFIGEHAFDSCDSLISVTVPEGVDEIGEHAFDKCYNMECVTILSPQVDIGEGALDDVDLVRCHEDSDVWEYCEEKDIECEPI